MKLPAAHYCSGGFYCAALLAGNADRQSKGHRGIKGDGIPVTVPLYLTVNWKLGRKRFARSAVVVVKKKEGDEEKKVGICYEVTFTITLAYFTSAQSTLTSGETKTGRWYATKHTLVMPNK